MASVLQPGFLNHVPGGGSSAKSKSCVSSRSNKPSSGASCFACQSQMCKSCVNAPGDRGQEMRKCETCIDVFCRSCRDVCNEPDCQDSVNSASVNSAARGNHRAQQRLGREILDETMEAEAEYGRFAEEKKSAEAKSTPSTSSAVAAPAADQHKRAGTAANNGAAASGGASAAAVGDQPQKQRGTNMMPKKVKKKKGKKKGGSKAAAPAPAPAVVPVEYSPPPAASFSVEMDHSVIKKWVLEVAKYRVSATPQEIKRYFNGRVESAVIDVYLEGFENDCRATVIQCAEFLNIIVPPDGGDVQDHNEEHKEEPGKNESEETERRDSEDSEDEGHANGEEDVNDDLLGAAFGAKERTKHGEFLADEHPLERRANEAKQNDCKDPEVWKAILEEAHGEVGLQKMKKMVKKNLKRILQEREEQKQQRRQNQLKSGKETISQKLHPAYVNKEPSFSSYQPPNIPGDRPPDRMMDIPPNVVGWVIGKSGIRINEIQQRTQAAMWMDQNFPDNEMRKLHIHGSKAQVAAAVQEVENLLNSAPVNVLRPGKMGQEEAAANGVRLPPGHQDLKPSYPKTLLNKKTVLCPHALVGYLIGKKGVMIKRIKEMSQANVEIFQCFPEGVPREVIITGSEEEVMLAEALVGEVIAAGTASDNAPGAPERSASGLITSNPAGPVLGFSSTQSQASSTPSVSTVTHDFGDLGGLGNGAATSMSGGGSGGGAPESAAFAGINGHASTSPVATQMAIDNLHKAPPGLGRAVSAPGMDIHEEYMAQQEALALRQRQAQHLGQQAQLHLQAQMGLYGMPQHQDWQQQHQLQQHQLQQHQLQQQQLQALHAAGAMAPPPPPPPPPVFVPPLPPPPVPPAASPAASTAPPVPPAAPPAASTAPPAASTAPLAASTAPPAASTAPPVPPAASQAAPPVAVTSPTAALLAPDAPPPTPPAVKSGDGDGNGNVTPPPLFDSVEDLLAKAGQTRFLDNFLAQEFDVNAIVLMEEKDFAEIEIPFGPQKKIQKAIKAAIAKRNGTPMTNGGGARGCDPPAVAPVSASASASATALAATAPAERMCALCEKHPAEVTFIGCGHHICCAKCGNDLVNLPCPVCRVKVERAVRPFTG